MQRSNALKEIKRISSKEQKKRLAKKLDDRINFTLSADKNNPQYEANRALLNQMCKDDWKFFVNNFVWLQDPEADEPEDKNLPFLLWDFQELSGDQIVKAIVGMYDLPIEKTRKLGATWLMLAIIVWAWHFKEWDSIVGSKTERDVDKRGKMGTLFEKLRYIINRLPEWMFPIPLDHYTDKLLILQHPIHKTNIAGESNAPNFGRSGRAKFAFLDEFTSWDQTDRAAYQAVSSTVKCRIPLSTPNRKGVNCWFYKVIKDAHDNNKPILTLDWKLHPEFSEGIRPTQPTDLAFQYDTEFTSPWLEDQIKRASDTETVAQEVLINYEAAMAGKVFAAFSYENQVTVKAEYNSMNPIYVSWDFGLDTTALVWIQPNYYTNTYDIIDEYENDGTTKEGADIQHYIDIVQAKPYKAATHFGDPHSGNNRNLAARGESNATMLKRNGIRFRSKRTPVVTRVGAGRNMLSKMRVHPRCQHTIDMFTSWQMKNSKTGSGTSVPDHREHSHIGEAYTYFCFNYSELMNQGGKKKERRQYKPSASGLPI